MDMFEWTSKMNSIKINDSIRNNIIKFFKKFSSNQSFSFIKVEDDDMILAFNNINNYKPVSICLDAEFQTTLIKKKEKDKYIHTVNYNDDLSAKFIREIGMLFFIKDMNNNWYYIGSIFLNFNSLEKYGFNINYLRSIGSKYSTVTDKTYKEMLQNETDFNLDLMVAPLQNEDLFQDKKEFSKQMHIIIGKLKSNYLFNKILDRDHRAKILNSFNKILEMNNYNDVLKELKYIKKQLYNIQFDIYGEYLNDSLLVNLKKTHKLYWSDKLVKERLVLVNRNEKLFFEILSNLARDSIFILKGVMDIAAIKNTSMLITKKAIEIENYYNIETFNGFSRNLYNSSQLEETYNNLIKSHIYQTKAKQFFEQISSNIGDKAHNPLVDSLFTIIVAITINLGLNKYFGEIDKNQFGGNLYYREYIKLKNRYLQLKNIH